MTETSKPLPQPQAPGPVDKLDREFRWKPYGLLAGVIVACFAVAMQFLVMHGAVAAGILSREESVSDGTMIGQTAAWAAAPFILFSLLIEPLVRATGAKRAVAGALVTTVLAWTWAGFEAWRAAGGITIDSFMPANGLISGALLLVLPLPLFLVMAAVGKFLAGPRQSPPVTEPPTKG
jgi:hypothetical protein